MKDNDLITIPDPTPAGRYTQELAHRLHRGLGLNHLIDAEHLELIIETALHQAGRDIIAGRFVYLQDIGEFCAVENRGPMIRYQADRRLIEACCINNLKSQGGH